MNRRQRRRKLERARQHRAATRKAGDVDVVTAPASAPRPSRKRPLAKRAVRAMGRKLRPERLTE